MENETITVTVPDPIAFKAAWREEDEPFCGWEDGYKKLNAQLGHLKKDNDKLEADGWIIFRTGFVFGAAIMAAIWVLTL